jgi:hypothetical protein
MSFGNFNHAREAFWKKPIVSRNDFAVPASGRSQPESRVVIRDNV